MNDRTNNAALDGAGDPASASVHGQVEVACDCSVTYSLQDGIDKARAAYDDVWEGFGSKGSMLNLVHPLRKLQAALAGIQGLAIVLEGNEVLIDLAANCGGVEYNPLSGAVAGDLRTAQIVLIEYADSLVNDICVAGSGRP